MVVRAAPPFHSMHTPTHVVGRSLNLNDRRYKMTVPQRGPARELDSVPHRMPPAEVFVNGIPYQEDCAMREQASFPHDALVAREQALMSRLVHYNQHRHARYDNAPLLAPSTFAPRYSLASGHH